MSIGVTDVLRVIVTWDMPQSTVAKIVYHYLVTTGTTATEAEFIAAAIALFETAWALIDDRVADNVTGSTMAIQKYDFVNHQWDGIEEDVLEASDGISAAQMLSHGDAGLIKILTQSARRQCRKYLPGLTEDALTDGILSVATVVDLALFGSALDANLLAGDITALYGSFNTDVESVLYETFSQRLGTVIGEAVPAYQRRRRPGTGI